MVTLVRFGRYYVNPDHVIRLYATVEDETYIHQIDGVKVLVNQPIETVVRRLQGDMA